MYNLHFNNVLHRNLNIGPEVPVRILARHALPRQRLFSGEQGCGAGAGAAGAGIFFLELEPEPEPL